MHEHTNHHRWQPHRNHHAGRSNTAHSCCFAILSTEHGLHVGLSGDDAHNHGAQAKKAILHTATKKTKPGVRRQGCRKSGTAAHLVEG